MTDKIVLKEALLKAFNEVDKTKTGHVKCVDVENILTIFNNNPEVIKKLDKTLIKKEATHFCTTLTDKEKPITKDEFIDYFVLRIPNW